MTVQTVKLAGKRFVIVPEKDFRRLQRQAEQAAAQDKGDIAETKRREHEPSIPLAVTSPRLAHAQQASAFRKQIVSIPTTATQR